MNAEGPQFADMRVRALRMGMHVTGNKHKVLQDDNVTKTRTDPIPPSIIAQ